MRLQWTKILVPLGLGVFALAAIAADESGGNAEQKHPKGQRKQVHALAWSKAEGKPQIEAGRSVGFFIWHEGNVVHVVTTSESDKGRKFAGRVVLRPQNATITNVQGEHLEKDDKVRQPRPNVLMLKFDTHEGIDEVQFTINGGKHIVFMLRQGGHKTEHVFYGAKAIEAEHDPVVFDLSK